MRLALAKPRRGWGGGTTIALALAGHLRSAGHSVVLLCHPRARIRAQAAAQGFPVEAVLAGHDFPLPGRWRTRRAIQKHRCDLVLTFMSRPGDLEFAVPAARALGLPVVARRASAGAITMSRRERAWFADVDAWVAVSHAIAHELGVVRPPARNVTVIYNGTDVERFARAQPATLPVPADALVFGFVGRIHEAKGLRDLHAAWRQVSARVEHAHLVLAGEGEHEAAMRALFADQPRVHWLGYRTDAPELHRALDVLVLPTHAEGFPNTIVEAMAAGSAVVSTRVDGPVEAIEDGRTGLLAPPHDPERLADAMLRLALDPELRRRLGADAQAHAARHFDRHDALERYVHVLESVAHG